MRQKEREFEGNKRLMNLKKKKNKNERKKNKSISLFLIHCWEDLSNSFFFDFFVRCFNNLMNFNDIKV